MRLQLASDARGVSYNEIVGFRVDKELQNRREACVRTHIEAENRHDVEGIVASFHRPRYEVMPLLQVSDGASAVREMWLSFLESFPDARIEATVIHHAETAVIVEAVVSGTHQGAYLDIPPTNRKVNIPMACVFVFEEDRLVCEKLYFDAATRLRQIWRYQQSNAGTGRRNSTGSLVEGRRSASE
jgi:steroid delta-isomerase-like uncharacterized protein